MTGLETREETMLTKNIIHTGWSRKAVAAALLAATAHAHAWTVVVNDAGDTTGSCATSGTGSCTLRDAFTYANANHAAGDDNRIEFNIAGGGEHTIASWAELPLAHILHGAYPSADSGGGCPSRCSHDPLRAERNGRAY